MIAVRPAWLALAGLVCLAVAGAPARATEPRAPLEPGCVVARETRSFDGDLPLARGVIGDGRKLTIIALGSSSTLGTGASSEDLTYPAIMRAELGRLLPGHDIDVVNAGIGGNSAHQMYQRLEADVLDYEPKLVIWQTGVYEAMHDIGIEKFKRILRKGIARMREGGADVVLMDQIMLPRMERYPAFGAYMAAMREVAAETGTPLFRRGDMLASLLAERRLTAEELLPGGSQHTVDASYYCVGINLARTLAEKLSPRAAPETR